MTVPRIGVSVPHFGPYAGPDAVVTVAQAAERCGFRQAELLAAIAAELDLARTMEGAGRA